MIGFSVEDSIIYARIELFWGFFRVIPRVILAKYVSSASVEIFLCSLSFLFCNFSVYWYFNYISNRMFSKSKHYSNFSDGFSFVLQHHKVTSLVVGCLSFCGNFSLFWYLKKVCLNLETSNFNKQFFTQLFVWCPINFAPIFLRHNTHLISFWKNLPINNIFLPKFR